MTNKAIFDVDVDTTKFSEFLKLYDRYQSTLKTLPAGWQAVGGRAEEASALWAKVSGQADRQAAAAKIGGARGRNHRGGGWRGCRRLGGGDAFGQHRR